MIPQNEMEFRRLSLIVDRSIVIFSTITMMLALPFVVPSLVLLEADPVISLVTATVTGAYSIWFAHRALKQYYAPNRILSVAKERKASLDNWLDYSNWLRFDLLGLGVAYHPGLFIEPTIGSWISSEKARELEAREIVKGLTIGTNPGYIYVMRRQDGVIKIGRTNNTKRRLSQHIKDYKTQFRLIHRFVVPDTVQFEKLALGITGQFAYRESGRIELRKMSNDELKEFIGLFQWCCILAINK